MDMMRRVEKERGLCGRGTINGWKRLYGRRIHLLLAVLLTNFVCWQVPKDKLFYVSVKDGWEPLCRALDLPVPEVRSTYEAVLRELTCFQGRPLS